MVGEGEGGGEGQGCGPVFTMFFFVGRCLGYIVISKVDGVGGGGGGIKNENNPKIYGQYIVFVLGSPACQKIDSQILRVKSHPLSTAQYI